jgi:hypothetical protein
LDMAYESCGVGFSFSNYGDKRNEILHERKEYEPEIGEAQPEKERLKEVREEGNLLPQHGKGRGGCVTPMV